MLRCGLGTLNYFTTYHHHPLFQAHQTGSADTDKDSPAVDHNLYAAAAVDGDDDFRDPGLDIRFRPPGCADSRATADGA